MSCATEANPLTWPLQDLTPSSPLVREQVKQRMVVLSLALRSGQERANDVEPSWTRISPKHARCCGAIQDIYYTGALLGHEMCLMTSSIHRHRGGVDDVLSSSGTSLLSCRACGEGREHRRSHPPRSGRISFLRPRARGRKGRIEHMRYLVTKASCVARTQELFCTEAWDEGYVTAGGILVSDVGWSSASGRGTKDAENVLKHETYAYCSMLHGEYVREHEEWDVRLLGCTVLLSAYLHLWEHRSY